MRLALWLLLATLLIPVAGAEGAIDVDDEGRVLLYAHWPASVAEGMAGPIIMDEVFPVEEPDLSEGPATPGASAAGTEHTWTYRLHDFYGRIGPIGDLRLDTAVPAMFHFYLSADQTPWPSPAGPAPKEVDHGVVPNVTVEVRLAHQNRTVGTGAQTHDLVNLPDPVGGTIQHYAIPVPHDLARIPSGSGLDVQITVRQAQAGGQDAMQPLYNVHTGEAYPTGLALPIENPGALLFDGESSSSLDVAKARETLSAMSVKTVEEEPYAWTALTVAMAAMVVTGGRMVHRWRQR